MKEIIYLDTKLINSILAQNDQGLVLKRAFDKGETSSNSDEIAHNVSLGTSGGVSLGANVNVKRDETSSNKQSLVYSETNKELIEVATHDYALDILLETLKDHDYIENKNPNEGQFILQNNNITFYDFKKLHEAMDIDKMRLLFPEIFQPFDEFEKELNKLLKSNKEKHKERIAELQEKIDNSLPKVFSQMNQLSDYMIDLYDGAILAKVGKTISICEPDYIRLKPSLLSIMNLSKRKATILGIVTAKEAGNISLENLNSDSASEIFSNIANSFMEIINTSFDITTEGDYYVRPIAIYFE